MHFTGAYDIAFLEEYNKFSAISIPVLLYCYGFLFDCTLFLVSPQTQ